MNFWSEWTSNGAIVLSHVYSHTPFNHSPFRDIYPLVGKWTQKWTESGQNNTKIWIGENTHLMDGLKLKFAFVAFGKRSVAVKSAWIGTKLSTDQLDNWIRWLNAVPTTIYREFVPSETKKFHYSQSIRAFWDIWCVCCIWSCFATVCVLLDIPPAMVSSK